MRIFSEFVGSNLKNLKPLKGKDVSIESLDESRPFSISTRITATPEGDMSTCQALTFNVAGRRLGEYGIDIRWLEWNRDGQTFASYNSAKGHGHLPVRAVLP